MTYSPGQIRALFPICERSVYLNNAGVAPTSTLVKEAANIWIDDLVQHGIHSDSEWEAKSEQVRVQSASLIGASSTEITFIRNTSHGLALVAEGLHWNPGDEIAVCTELEYPSNIYVWENLSRLGVDISPIQAPSGGVTRENVASALTSNTKLVALSAVQYATGFRSDLAGIGDLCRERGILLCVDGIQMVGSAPLDVKSLGIHFLAADSHKWMLGLSGIGLLFVDEAVISQVRPALVGWKSTEDAFNFDRAHFVLRKDAAKFEEGSPNYIGIYGMGAAISLLLKFGLRQVEEHLSTLLGSLEEELVTLGCATSPPSALRGGLLFFTPPRGEAAALYDHLSEHKIRTSLRRGQIRVSPHIYTNQQDLTALVEQVKNFLGALP